MVEDLLLEDSKGRRTLCGIYTHAPVDHPLKQVGIMSLIFALDGETLAPDQVVGALAELVSALAGLEIFV